MGDDEQDEEPERGGAGTEKKGNRIRPRERYRALIDILDEGQTLIAIGDRKARFALMILAAFNAAIIVGGSMSYKLMSDLPDEIKIACGAAMFFYGITAIYFFILAIDSIRPRKAPVSSMHIAAGTTDTAGLRFYLDIVKHRADDYWDQIRSMDYDRLNRELAYQVHAVSSLIASKYNTLATLYLGMRILTLGAAVILVGVAGSVSAYYFFR